MQNMRDKKNVLLIFIITITLISSCATMYVRQHQNSLLNPLNEIKEPENPLIIEGTYNGDKVIDNIEYSIYSFKNLLMKDDNRILQIKLPSRPQEGYNNIYISEQIDSIEAIEKVKILFINQSNLYSFEKEELEHIKSGYFNKEHHKFIFAKANNNRGIKIHYIDNDLKKWDSFFLHEDDLEVKYVERNSAIYGKLAFMYTGSVIFDIATAPLQGLVYIILRSTNTLTR